MDTFEEKELRKLFKDEESYKKYLNFLYSVETYFVDNYMFLNFKEQTWRKLVIKYAIKKNKPVDNKNEIKNSIKAVIKIYINKKIEENNMQIITNMIEFLSRRNKTNSSLLYAFFNELKELGIILTDESYNKLKSKCKSFNQILKNIGIENFSKDEVCIYTDPKNKKYIYLKPLNKNVRESTKIIDKILSNISKEYVDKIKIEIEKEQHGKIVQQLKYIVANYEIFQKVYEVLISQYEISYSLYLNTIIQFKESDLRIINENYYVYLAGGIDYNSFLYKIIDYIIKSQNKIIKKTISQEIKLNDIPSKAKAKTLVNSNCKSKKNMRTIYDLFPNYEEVTKEKKQEVIDYLYNKLDEERKEDIQKYLTKELEYRSKKYNRTTNYISKLRKQYNKIYKNGMQLIEKEIYDLFPDYEDVPKEKKQEVIDYLYNKLGEETKEDIKKYLTKELEYKGKKYQRTIYFIRKLIKQYNETHENGMQLLKKGRKIYDLFPDYKDVTKEKKQEVIEYLYNKLDEETKEIIQKYLSKELEYKSKKYQRALYYIAKLRKQYNEIHESGMQLLEKEIEIYDLFPNYEGVTKEKKQEVIDYLYNKLDEEIKEDIRKYLTKEIIYKNEKYQRTLYFIRKLIKQYNEMHENGMQLLEKEIEIYDLFPDYEGVTKEKKQEVIDYLYNKLDEETKEDIQKYLTKELEYKSKKYQRAIYYIAKLRKQYNSIQVMSNYNAIITEYLKSIKEHFTNIPEDEIVILCKSLQKINYVYLVLGFTEKQYLNYMKALLNEIKMSLQTISETELIQKYIEITEGYLSQDISLKLKL